MDETRKNNTYLSLFKYKYCIEQICFLIHTIYRGYFLYFSSAVYKSVEHRKSYNNLKKWVLSDLTNLKANNQELDGKINKLIKILDNSEWWDKAYKEYNI